MSLFGALSASVTGLAAQGEAMSVISDNLANTNTIGYKANRALFSQLVTSAGVSDTKFNAGGVSTDIQRAQNIQGALESSDSTTDMALSGSGFFVLVSDSNITPDTATYYSRAGSFVENSLGYLQHPSGNYLLGWRTDSAGNIIDLQNPEPVELQTVSSSASPTSELDLGITLNANTNIYNFNTSLTLDENLQYVVENPTHAQYVTDERFYDSQGGARDISIAYIKTSDNTWSYAAYTDGSNIVGGNPGTNTIIGTGNMSFKENGSLESVSNSDISVNWSGGVETANITLNFGSGKGGFVFHTDAHQVGGLAIQQQQVLQNTTNDPDTQINLPANATNGDYTISYLGGNDYQLTLPNATTQTVTATGVLPETLTFSGGITVDITAIPAAPVSPLEVLNSQIEGGVTGMYIDEDSYYAVHGEGALIQGNFTIDWDSSTGEIVITDPEGGVYSQAVDTADLSNRTLEFTNGVSINLSPSWIPPTRDMNLGSITPTLSQPVGSGVGTDGALQLASSNNIRFSIQNGFGAGDLSSISIDGDGYVSGSFTNGETNQLFKLVVGVFQNPSALEPISGNLFTQTEASGLPLYREAGVGGTAEVVSGALEQSTVDIATEFSEMIITQRGYQANSKVITTVDQMLNDLLNLR